MNALFHASGTPRQSGVRAANAALQQAGKITPLTPADGVDSRSIAPTPGVESLSTAPEDGAIRGCFGHLSIPGGGDHLEKPSVPEFKPRTQRKLNAIQHAGCSTELKRKQLVLFTGGAVLCLMASKQRHLTPEKHKTREGRCHHLQAGSYQVQCLLTGASAPSLYGYGRNGQKGNLLRTSTGVFFTSRPPYAMKTQTVGSLDSPVGTKPMTVITQRTNAPTPSKQDAIPASNLHAVLAAFNASNLASSYIERGNFAAARRKLTQALASINSLTLEG